MASGGGGEAASGLPAARPGAGWEARGGPAVAAGRGARPEGWGGAAALYFPFAASFTTA